MLGQALKALARYLWQQIVSLVLRLLIRESVAIADEKQTEVEEASAQAGLAHAAAEDAKASQTIAEIENAAEAILTRKKGG